MDITLLLLLYGYGIRQFARRLNQKDRLADVYLQSSPLEQTHDTYSAVPSWENRGERNNCNTASEET